MIISQMTDNQSERCYGITLILLTAITEGREKMKQRKGKESNI